MRRRIRLTESELQRIVEDSVNNVLNEGFGDRIKGAFKGFRTGANQQMANADDAETLTDVYNWAQEGIKSGDPQKAMKILQQIVKLLTTIKQHEKQNYGNLKYTNMYM